MIYVIRVLREWSLLDRIESLTGRHGGADVERQRWRERDEETEMERERWRDR